MLVLEQVFIQLTCFPLSKDDLISLGKEVRKIKKELKEQRKEILKKSFRVDNGKIRPFSEEDRGEDRD
jgi:hypothetical protein